MPQEPRRYRFPPAARLRTKADFDRVLRARRRTSDQYLTLYTAHGPAPTARLGIAVGRRFGNAVARNRIKRLIREAFRHLRPDLPPGTDWVVIPHPGRHAAYHEIRNSLGLLCARLLAKQAHASR